MWEAAYEGALECSQAAVAEEALGNFQAAAAAYSLVGSLLQQIRHAPLGSSSTDHNCLSACTLCLGSLGFLQPGPRARVVRVHVLRALHWTRGRSWTG